VYISRIAISGFRNFRDLDLFDLPASVVVVGENGAGKSNLLYALGLVLDPSLPDTARQLSAEDFWDGFDAPFDGEEITVAVELVDFEGDKAAMALLGDYLVATGPKVARLTYAYRPRPLVKDPSNEADYEAVVYGGHRDDQRVGREVLHYVSLPVLPALRDAESDLASARSPLRRLLARVELDPVQLATAQDRIAEAGQALLADDGNGAINTGITDRLSEMVGTCSPSRRPSASPRPMPNNSCGRFDCSSTKPSNGESGRPASAPRTCSTSPCSPNRSPRRKRRRR
jgi:putative ATP-dependent endonuclease of OLD family